MLINLADTDFHIYAEQVRTMNSSADKKVYIVTFGCQQNEADSEKIRGMAHSMGYADTDTPEDADMIVLNTCAIRQHAEEKALSLLILIRPILQK